MPPFFVFEKKGQPIGLPETWFGYEGFEPGFPTI